MSHILRTLGALLLTILVLPDLAVAQGTAAITFTGATGRAISAYQVTLEPGEQAEIPVRITLANADSLEVDIRLSAVTSPPNGGFALDAATGNDPLRWLSFDGGDITLASGTAFTGEIAVEVPESVKPGVYTAALVLTRPADETTPLREREVVPIVITVPGTPVASFTLGDATRLEDRTGVAWQFPIVNTGTVPIAPAGTLTIGEAEPLPVSVGIIFPGVSTTLTIPESATDSGTEVILSLTDSATGARATQTVVELERGATPVATTAVDQGDQELISISDPVVVAIGTPVSGFTISVNISNLGSPVRDATVMIDVFEDGEPVQSVSLAEHVTLVDGATNVSAEVSLDEGVSAARWTARIRILTYGSDGSATTVYTSRHFSLPLS